MHETVFAQRLLAEAGRHGQVKSIVICVGKLAHVPPEDLYATIKAMAPFPVKMEVIDPVIECGCGFIGEPKVLERGHDICIYECPRCTQVPPLKTGDEIMLKSVEV